MATAVWRIQDPNNDDWTLGGSPDDFWQGDNVTFPEVGVTTYNIEVVDSVSPSSMVVDSTTDYTIGNNGGSIGGTGSLTKRGTSTLNISGTNSYLGGTTIEAGAIAMGDGGALGTGSLTFAGSDPNTAVTVSTSNDYSTLSGIVVSGFGDNVMVANHGTSWENPGLTGTGSITYATNTDGFRLGL